MNKTMLRWAFFIISALLLNRLNSINDVKLMGGVLCAPSEIHYQLLGEYFELKPLLLGQNEIVLITGNNASDTKTLLDMLIQNKCDAVIASDIDYKAAYYDDLEYCSSTIIHRDEVVLEAKFVIPFGSNDSHGNRYNSSKDIFGHNLMIEHFNEMIESGCEYFLFRNAPFQMFLTFCCYSITGVAKRYIADEQNRFPLNKTISSKCENGDGDAFAQVEDSDILWPAAFSAGFSTLGIIMWWLYKRKPFQFIKDVGEEETSALINKNLNDMTVPELYELIAQGNQVDRSKLDHALSFLPDESELIKLAKSSAIPIYDVADRESLMEMDLSEILDELILRPEMKESLTNAGLDVNLHQALASNDVKGSVVNLIMQNPELKAAVIHGEGSLSTPSSGNIKLQFEQAQAE